MQIRFLIVLIFIVFGSCKNATPAEEATVTNEEIVELDGDFVKFYNRFHKDSVYQWNHIAFPLEKEDGTMWTSENWIMHHPFTDGGGMFERNIEVIGKVVIEEIYDANGFFHMTRNFADLTDGWNLILYKIENPGLQDSQEEQ